VAAAEWLDNTRCSDLPPKTHIRTYLEPLVVSVSGKRVLGAEKKAPKGRPSDNCAVSETERVRDNAANPGLFARPQESCIAFLMDLTCSIVFGASRCDRFWCETGAVIGAYQFG
jgi:hypothetical protein